MLCQCLYTTKGLWHRDRPNFQNVSVIQTNVKRVEAERRCVETKVAAKQMRADRTPSLLVGLISLHDSDLLCTSRKVGFS